MHLFIHGSNKDNVASTVLHDIWNIQNQDAIQVDIVLRFVCTQACVNYHILRHNKFYMKISFHGKEKYRSNHRSNRPEVLCKKGVLKSVAKFIGKHLCQRFFNKVLVNF